MTKKIQFNNIKEITIITDNELLLEFDQSVIFDTTGTFTEGRRSNRSFQWPIKEIRLNDLQEKFTDELRDLAQNFQGKKIEFSFQESEMQLMLFPKASPLMIFGKDKNRINVSFQETHEHLEIELNDKYWQQFPEK